MKLFLLSAVLFSYSLTANAFEIQTLTIARPLQNYPPYHWIENGVVKGILPDVIAEAAALTNIQRVTYKSVPWRRMLELGKTGKVKAVFPLNFTEERQMYFEYVKEPIAYEAISFAKLKSTKVEFTSSSASQFKVGTVSGYYYIDAIEKLQLNKLEVPNESIQIKLLFSKRADFILIDTNVVNYYQNLPKTRENLYHDIMSVEPSFEKTPLHIAFSKVLNNSMMVENLSEALKQLKTSGRYQKILAKYIPNPPH